jgi:hypothetical protein
LHIVFADLRDTDYWFCHRSESSWIPC